jgi:nicotinamide mononucleotide transporter
MEIQELLHIFMKQVKSTGYLEWFAVSFGVAEVLLAKRNKILLYPAGIVSIVLALYLKLTSKLYAESLLSMYYLVMSVYGWMIWSQRKRNKQEALPVSWTTKRELQIALTISIGGYFVLYGFLVQFTNSDVPILDAFVSSTAWAGMWLLARRKIENWIFLNVSNIVAIPLMWHKDFVMFALLTMFFFVAAIFGYIDWKKIYKSQQLKQLNS